jgi:hypothetical protein
LKISAELTQASVADVADAARLLDSFQFEILQCAFPVARGLPV